MNNTRQRRFVRRAALLVSTVAHALRLDGALRWARRTLLKDFRVVILAYHRIDDTNDPLEMAVSRHQFRAQLDYLRQHYRVVPLATAVSLLHGPEPLAEDVAVITFDDGYRDNLTCAQPELHRRSLPAHLFVTTGFVDGTDSPWFLTAARLFASLRHANRDVLPPAVRAHMPVPGGDAADRLIDFVQHLKGLDAAERHRVMNELAAAAARAGAEPVALLSWNEVATLADDGFEIGSHTITHPILSRIDRQHADREIAESRKILTDRLSRPIGTFAYPNGHPEDYTDADVRSVRTAGYTAACTTTVGFNRPGDDVFRLKRIGVGNDPPALFAAKIEGLLMPLYDLRDRGRRSPDTLPPTRNASL